MYVTFRAANNSNKKSRLFFTFYWQIYDIICFYTRYRYNTTLRSLDLLYSGCDSYWENMRLGLYFWYISASFMAKKVAGILCPLTAFTNGSSTIEVAWGEDKGRSYVSAILYPCEKIPDPFYFQSL
jgi:hypothetical protein